MQKTACLPGRAVFIFWTNGDNTINRPRPKNCEKAWVKRGASEYCMVTAHAVFGLNDD